MALVAGASEDTDYVEFARTLDRAASTLGINFIGGFRHWKKKGFSKGDQRLIQSIPEALAVTERVCASVNIGTTKEGINMDAVMKWARSSNRRRC